MIAAEVYLWGTLIGVVEQADVSDTPRFNYAPDFLRSGREVAPFTMPLSDRIYSFPELNVVTFFGLPGLLADSLPDKFGTRLIERYLAEQGRTLSSLTAVERLCYVGSRGMGALEYVPAYQYAADYKESLQIDALVRLASDVLSERMEMRLTDNVQIMEQILRVGTSAGGARAKAIVAWNEKMGDIRSGQIETGDGYGHWIIKFDGVENNKDKGDRADDPAYTRIEYAYHLMTVAAGITMSPCRLLQRDGRYHFMTRRFDRDPQNGEKIHMLTLGGMAHYDFNDVGAYSYEQVAQILQRLHCGQNEIAELYRRMVFNAMTCNYDDHVKNISFLMNRRGEWHLSPAYDITYAYDPTNRWLAKHQMSINCKLDGIAKEDLMQCGKSMNLRRTHCEYILDDVQKAVSDWRKWAEKAFVPEDAAEFIRGQFHCNRLS